MTMQIFVLNAARRKRRPRQMSLCVNRRHPARNRYRTGSSRMPEHSRGMRSNLHRVGNSLTRMTGNRGIRSNHHNMSISRNRERSRSSHGMRSNRPNMGSSRGPGSNRRSLWYSSPQAARHG